MIAQPVAGAGTHQPSDQVWPLAFFNTTAIGRRQLAVICVFHNVCKVEPEYLHHNGARTVWRDQNFDRYRYRDFLSETKFSETNTETFFPRPNFPIPRPRLFFRDQIFRYRYRDFFSETKFFDTETETFFPRPNFPIPIPRLPKK